MYVGGNVTALDDTSAQTGSTHVQATHAEVAHAVDTSVDDRAVLHEEIDRLRQRVEDLEFTVTEYRNQMGKVLGSASWKATSPFRALASRVRRLKARAKRAIQHRRERNPNSDHKVLTAGLFMPGLETIPITSPLRKKIDVNTLRRPPQADGPLHRPDGEPTVAVVAHIHYPELWGDIEDRLVRMPVPYDLICTVTEGHAEAAIPHIMSRHPKARIEIVPNRGRDWAPTVRLLNQGLLSGYHAVAKVHTKKSEHRIDGDGWRLSLLDGIFESPTQIQSIIDLLHEDRDVGLVVPNGHIEGTEHWGSNQGIVEALAYRLPMAFDPDELRFAGGSMFWCRPWLLERLSDLDINDEHFEAEAGQYDGTTAHALERLVGIFTQVGGMDIVEVADVKKRLATYRKNPRTKPNIYCFYLPQYHQCPENDEFWGEGFTDWDNVKKAKPLFEGHRQPILPSEEVGFYDLKDPEVLRKQWAMASQYGIDGFVFHYYWFDGRKVLDTPLNNWLADPTIELPLALCWANEPWTRRWDGLDKDVLIPQTYGEDWANRFWDDISPVLADPRYIRWEDAPVLVIYRLGQIPEATKAIETWRKRAADDGHPRLHVIAVAPPREERGWPSSVRDCVDDVLAYPPGSGVNIHPLKGLTGQDLIPGRADAVLSYDAAFSPTNWSDGSLPCVFAGWDNTARRGASAFVFLGANPLSWRGILYGQSGVVSSGSHFVNSLNEWAEGASGEASRRFGSSYLSGLRDGGVSHAAA